MALDPASLDIVGSPEWWMQTLAKRLLDRNRVKRLAVLEAYRAGCPPMPMLAASERSGFYNFQRVARSNFARTIVNARTERQRIRAIRTAAANDDNGDKVAWSYFTGSGLDVAAPDVTSDRWTFSEAYVRVGIGPNGKPIAMRCDPRFTITAQDPLNPAVTIAAFQLLWDEYTGHDYAYLWLPGEQWVADKPRPARPAGLNVPGVNTADARRFGYWWPRLSFDPSAFTMRPNVRDVPEGENDGRPYSQSYNSTRVPVERFGNRDGVGVYEEHLDLLDRINHTVMQRVVIAAVQAYKQRALEQPDDGKGDRVPERDPNTGKPIDWDEIFAPGPDALWKLPPGVKIWESRDANLQPILQSATDDIKQLSSVTSTPLPLMSDDTNQSAEAAQLRREGLVFSVEDACSLDGRHWANVVSMMFEMAPDEDRFDGDPSEGRDRADVGQIVVDWYPAERYSLAEKSAADAANKSLSRSMAAQKIWGLTPDEVAINEAQVAAEALLAAAGDGTAA